MRLAMMATQSTGGPETWTKSRPEHETGEVMKDGPARILIMARSPKSSTQRPDTCVQNCVLIARQQACGSGADHTYSLSSSWSRKRSRASSATAVGLLRVRGDGAP